ncbi:bis(5'-nucleosyl)-tetraphosphatase (symmetrical) YqeK [Carnobacterium inhibens]|uniref:bis(5'-nucleosyl)-tetraphosphatase (symmetrical) YqeK n=1 Tax=Carnobacterium inhibens TaxID=147709 RepID=UPI0006924ACF|nr:bis(5'-nucleosyl)-tetraphosphatase (symmetrical) YqeK [Carnobacterium inhibens]
MKERGFLTPVTENFLHAFGVGKVAFELALKNNINPETAFIAGSLHDLGGAIPTSDRISVAESFGIALTDEEYQIPMLIHAKQGAYFAQALFDIENTDILDAILYHTTCIDEASPLVKIVFLADKIHWDRNGDPPYLEGLLSALNSSLDEGCKYFLEWLWDSDLYVVHPFLKRSYSFYIQKKKFPVITRQNINAVISSEVREKYYLNEIVSQFQYAFQMGFKAYELAKNKNINADNAFLAAVLSNATNTIFDEQQSEVAKIIGIDTNGETPESLLPKLSCYFAKNEFDIVNLELLNAILHHRQKYDYGEELCQVVANAYQSLEKR